MPVSLTTGGFPLGASFTAEAASGIVFDGPNKTIILPNGTTDVSIVELWSRWCDWLALDDNLKYLPALRSVGGDAISATKNLGVTFFILNGWKIRPYEGDHRLTVTGNLYTDPAGGSPFVDTLGAYNVVIEMQVSNLSDSTVAQMDQINAAVYRGQVALDVAHGSAGTTFPKGTHQYPSNNMTDLLTIAAYYGIEVVVVHGNLTVMGYDISELTLMGENPVNTFVTVDSSATTLNTHFKDLFLINSTLDGATYLDHCYVNNVSNVDGFIENSIIAGPLGLSGGTLFIIDCKSGANGIGSASTPVLNFAGLTDTKVVFRNWDGPVEIINSTHAGNSIVLNVVSAGHIKLGVSNTAGSVAVHGICSIDDTSAMTVEDATRLDQASISGAVWGGQLEGLTAEEMMRVILAALAGKRAGIGTATETYYGRDGTTPRITLTPDALGNGVPTVNGAP